MEEAVKCGAPRASRKKTILQTAVNVAFSASFALLSLCLLIRYEIWTIAVTAVTAFAAALVFLCKTETAHIASLRLRPAATVLCGFFSLMLVTAIHAERNSATMSDIPIPAGFFRYRIMIFTLPALFLLLLLGFRRAAAFCSEMRDLMDSADRKIYAILTAFTSAAILAVYLADSRFYLQYDQVYSLDSGYCFNNLFPRIGYYDIRHPLLSVVTFPLYSIVRRGVGALLPDSLAQPVCAAVLQIFNVQCMLCIGFLLKDITHSRATALLYFSSAPVFLFTVFFEKFQICTFLAVYYAYRLCKDRNRELNFAAAAGGMTTSVILATGEFITCKPFSNKIRQLCRIAGVGIIFLICSGRAHLLNPATLLGEIFAMTGNFAAKGQTLKACIRSFSNFTQSTLIALPSVSGKTFTWMNITGRFSVFGIIVAGIMLLGLWTDRKNVFTRLCGIWFVAAPILFIVIRWSVDESPLFGLYFSWAFISLFQKGLRFIARKIHWNERMVFAAVSCLMLIANTVNMAHIIGYLA